MHASIQVFPWIAVSILVAITAPSQAAAAPPARGAPVGSFAPILEKVIPAVVTIRVTGETYTPVEIAPRRTGERSSVPLMPQKEVFRAGGSGVIVDPASGYIVTNNHVVENATRIEVGLSDGRRMPATLVGTDIGTDIAVIKVEGKNLPSIRIGNSDKVRVGDVVMAIGNPFGLEGTATLGIVSALMRTEVGHEAFEDFMQIDAQINPGNSGGALVNIKGELIGINTAVAGGPDRNVGIGFAIPINMAKSVKSELIAHGRMRRGSLGLIVEDLTPELVASVMAGVNRGALITRVLPNSAAAAAGIKPGGIVVGAANKSVRGAAEFNTRVVTMPVGSIIPVALYVNGGEKEYALAATAIAVDPVEHVVPTRLGGIAGAVVGEILPGNPLYGDLRGAQVLRVPADSPAYSAGLEVGDVIIGVDGGNVRTPGDLFRLADRAGMQYRIRLVRAGIPAWIRVSH